MVLRTLGIGLAVMTFVACGNETNETPDRRAVEVLPDAVPLGVWATGASETDWFTEEAAERGLEFVHHNGATGAFHYPELFPPGVALFDYDNDGDLDIFVVQGRTLDVNERALESTGQPLATTNEGGRLYRNDLVGDTAAGTGLGFTDVTGESLIAQTGYGIGVATGDVDNDGWVDLLITNFDLYLYFLGNPEAFFFYLPSLVALVLSDGPFYAY